MENSLYSSDTLLLCKGLLTYPNISYLSQIKSLSDEFRDCLKNFENIDCKITSVDIFFKKLKNETFLHDLFNSILLLKKEDFNLEEFLQTTIKSADNSKYSREEILISFFMILYFYLQETIFGPSFFFIYETEKEDYKKDLELFYNNNFFIIQNFIDLPEVKSQLTNYLTISGEAPYDNSRLLLFFIIPYYFFMKSSFNFNFFPIISIWKARIAYLHTNLLQNLVMSLKDIIFENLTKFEEFMPNLIDKNSTQIESLYLAEKSHLCLTFYKYSESDLILEKIKKILNLKIELTGRLGRKTKYQVFDSAVLVLETESSTINEKNSYLERVLSEETSKPTFIELDEENILLEKPKINDDTFLLSTELSIFDQIYVEGILEMLRKSFPDEELLREIILTYTRKSLDKSNDWLVYSKTLFHKCKVEEKRNRTIERALGQIKSLCDQFNDRLPKPYLRMHNLFVVDYPFIWKLKKYYAEIFMQYGAVSTAFEIFKELNMFEECINCLYLAGKKEQAEKFALDILKKDENPGVYCVLGELLEKEEYFHKALEVSKNKYIRAYRCLGRFCFNKNRINEAINYYEKALEINPLFPNIWFTLGCANLTIKNWEGAIRAFSQSIQIDDSTGEGWANLANAFSQIKKNKEALKCLEEGFKRSRTNWKICENLIYLSIDCQDLNKLFFGLSNIITLDKLDKIKPAIYYQMINLFVKKYSYLDSNMKEQYKNKIYTVFESFTMKDGVNVEIWDLYISFIETIEIKLQKEKMNEDGISKTYKKIVDIRLKQCRNYMIPEWEKSEKIIKSLEDMIKVMKEELLKVTRDQDFRKEVEIFIRSNDEKIQKFYKMRKFEDEIFGKNK